MANLFFMLHRAYLPYEARANAITGMAPRYVKVPNSAVDVNSRAELACYPRSSFYPIILGRL